MTFPWLEWIVRTVRRVFTRRKPDYLDAIPEAARQRFPSRAITFSLDVEAELQMPLRRALSDWQKALHEHEFVFSVTRSMDGGQIELRIGTLAPEHSGWTHTEAMPGTDGKRLQSAVCVIAPGMSAERTRAVARHEIGHALGLGGHSPDAGDALHSAHTPAAISERDVATIVRLYEGAP